MNIDTAPDDGSDRRNRPAVFTVGQAATAPGRRWLRTARPVGVAVAALLVAGGSLGLIGSWVASASDSGRDPAPIWDTPSIVDAASDDVVGGSVARTTDVSPTSSAEVAHESEIDDSTSAVSAMSEASTTGESGHTSAADGSDDRGAGKGRDGTATTAEDAAGGRGHGADDPAGDDRGGATTSTTSSSSANSTASKGATTSSSTPDDSVARSGADSVIRSGADSVIRSGADSVTRSGVGSEDGTGSQSGRGSSGSGSGGRSGADDGTGRHGGSDG